MFSFLSSGKYTPADRLSGIPGREPQRLRFPTVARLKHEEVCHIEQIRLPDGRYYSAVCLPRVDGGLTATRRLITDDGRLAAATKSIARAWKV